MVALKLVRIGDAVGVILPEEALAWMKVGEGDDLYLTEAQDGYLLTAYDPDFETQMDVARGIMKTRKGVLRQLTK